MDRGLVGGNPLGVLSKKFGKKPEDEEIIQNPAKAATAGLLAKFGGAKPPSLVNRKDSVESKERAESKLVRFTMNNNNQPKLNEPPIDSAREKNGLAKLLSMPKNPASIKS